VRLEPGDAYVLRSGGGGGYGHPFQRPAAQVLEDVRQGYISLEAARLSYSVVIDSDTMAVDQAQTATIRGEARAGPAPSIVYIASNF